MPRDDEDGMRDFDLLVNLLQLAVKDRTQLALENSALRHQLAVYKRSVKRPNIKDGDRIFWLTVVLLVSSPAKLGALAADPHAASYRRSLS